MAGGRRSPRPDAAFLAIATRAAGDGQIWKSSRRAAVARAAATPKVGTLVLFDHARPLLLALCELRRRGGKSAMAAFMKWSRAGEGGERCALAPPPLEQQPEGTPLLPVYTCDSCGSPSIFVDDFAIGRCSASGAIRSLYCSRCCDDSSGAPCRAELWEYAETHKGRW